jgi:glycosyltransferase involved in cell wall biosynthesis
VPAKIFDAMAMAKPIIATNVSDIPEILDSCGWIVEPENPRQLAETIKYVFEHPVEAKENGKKAREKCKREYSWNTMEKILIEVFRKYE